MKIALIGYGKMGKTIERIALERGHEIVARIDKDDDLEPITNAAVAIEFTRPDSAVNNMKYCAANQVPVICGTTGWHNDLDIIREYMDKHNGSLVHASNFSLGVNIFFELNKKLAQMMSGHPSYALEMQEIHHTQKIDAPSGTAVTLADGIIENSDYKKWHLGTTSNEESIAIEALREDDVKGTHSVSYKNSIDTIEIKHTAHSRDGFALGAVIAAEWIVKHKGIFTMKDVLGL